MEAVHDGPMLVEPITGVTKAAGKQGFRDRYLQALEEEAQAVARTVVIVEGLDELLKATLADAGYAGVRVSAGPRRTDIIIRATRVRAVLGFQGSRCRCLAAVVQKRFGLSNVALLPEQVIS